MASLSRREDGGFYIRTQRGFYATKQVHPDAVRYLNQLNVWVGDSLSQEMMRKLRNTKGWLYTKEEFPFVTFLELDDPAFGARPKPKFQGTTVVMTKDRFSEDVLFRKSGTSGRSVASPKRRSQASQGKGANSSASTTSAQKLSRDSKPTRVTESKSGKSVADSIFQSRQAHLIDSQVNLTGENSPLSWSEPWSDPWTEPVNEAPAASISEPQRTSKTAKRSTAPKTTTKTSSAKRRQNSKTAPTPQQPSPGVQTESLQELATQRFKTVPQSVEPVKQDSVIQPKPLSSVVLRESMLFSDKTMPLPHAEVAPSTLVSKANETVQVHAYSAFEQVDAVTISGAPPSTVLKNPHTIHPEDSGNLAFGAGRTLGRMWNSVRSVPLSIDDLILILIAIVLILLAMFWYY